MGATEAPIAAAARRTLLMGGIRGSGVQCSAHLCGPARQPGPRLPPQHWMVSASTERSWPYDRSPMTPVLHLADEGMLVPPVDDPAYLETLLEICRKHQVGVVIPLIDSELVTMAEARDRFAALGVRVLVSSPEVIRLCRDKQLTCEFLKAHGLGAPAVFSYEEALDGPFPLLMKPRFGSRGLGQHCLPDRPALVQREADRDVSVIQEYVCGQEFTVDVYAGLTGVPTVAVP